MAENLNLEPQTSNLFPLDCERCIAYQGKRGGQPTGQFFRHWLRRPERAHLLEFVRAKTFREGDLTGVTIGAAYVKLYRALALRVEGFRSPDPQRVPRGERIAAAMMLSTLERDEAAQPEVDASLDFVTLKALGNATGKPGEMQWFTGLVHCFQPLTEEEDVQLDRELSRRVPVGGSRRGETRAPELRESVLLRWYDRKIVEVRGYSVARQPLPPVKRNEKGEAVAEANGVIECMDPFHKLAAMEVLLSGAADVELPAAPDELSAEQLEEGIEAARIVVESSEENAA